MSENENWGMMGHNWAVNLLAEHLRRQTLRHAYLFAGPAGVGRRTLALRFAQAINCPQPLAPGIPCRQCHTCQRIERMQHPDLAVIQAEQVGGTLKVEQVRELQRSLALHPYEASYRIALLLRFEEAHPAAMNALLKTLEEPPERVILLVTAESPESLLPTIVSRCEVLRLRPLSADELAADLQQTAALSAEQAQFLARLAAGRPGYACQLHQNPALLEQRESWLDQMEKLLAADRIERFRYAERYQKDRDAFRNLVLIWLSLWRDVLLQALNSSVRLVNLDRQALIARLASQLDRDQIIRMVGALERTLNLLEQNVNVRLAAEVLLLDLPSVAASAD